MEPAPEYVPQTVYAGKWRITALSDGYMRLDGGAMWGVVPAVFWRDWTPPAADNSVLLALRPFLAERGADKVLIEVGAGERWDAKARAIYQFSGATRLVAALAACELAPTDITGVVASHCHWDHIGAQVVQTDTGGLAPLFPNARHFAPRVETEMAKNPGHVRRASYRADDVTVIEDAGLLTTYEGEAELLPGIRASVAGGHSDAIALVTIGAGSETAIFWSDVVPTSHHLQPPYIMAFDIDVARSYDVRRAWIERACEEGWTGMFYHDPVHAFGRIVKHGQRYAFEGI